MPEEEGTQQMETSVPVDPPASDTAATERRTEELETELGELQSTLQDVRQALAASERTREIERHLVREGAIDLETAALLAETAAAQMRDPDVAAAVADVKRRKPFLFRPSAARRTSAMSGEASPPPPLEDAAVEARQSGDRRALMRYLRLRRSG
jgi:hypothetical protein